MFKFQSEQELRITQSEFDRQAEITRLLLEGISSTHVSVKSFPTKDAKIAPGSSGGVHVMKAP